MSYTTIKHHAPFQAPREDSIEMSRTAKNRLIETERCGVLRCDWLRTVFVHLEINPGVLAPHVPFELDLHDGRAFVSLVAFVMRRFRPRGTGAIGSLLCAPVARHGLLNVRTYVCHRGEPGIYFLTEWINNKLSVFLGPRVFGLPYRFGRLRYRHDLDCDILHGRATSGDGNHQLRYRSLFNSNTSFRPAQRGTLDEFLLERYTAFTIRHGRPTLFRISHRPWMQAPIDVQLEDRTLLDVTGMWLRQATVVGANYSPGVRDVWLGRPQSADIASP